MTRISFLMPTYNRAHFIAESLQAILGQMDAADELVVIDDGSTDDTAAVVAQVAPRARYMRQENSGKSVALNRAMAATDGDYVWICDDDDLLRPAVVPALIDAIEQTDLGFVFGRYTRFYDDDAVRSDIGTGYWPNLACGSLPRHILEDAFVMQNAALVRRSAYVEVGPFDELMLRSLDYEMFVRLAIAVPSRYVDRVIFDQRKHPGARGPARALHAASDSAAVWNDYDRRIFERLNGWLSLDYYRAMFRGGEPMLIERAAHLQRAAVNARHDLWPLAIVDLEAAAAIRCGNRGLSEIEREICRRMVSGKHGFPGALRDDSQAALRKLLSNGESGREIVRSILSGLLWRLREPGAEHRAEAKALLSATIGSFGIASLLIDHAWHRGSRQRGDDRLEECETLVPLRALPGARSA